MYFDKTCSMLFLEPLQEMAPRRFFQIPVEIKLSLGFVIIFTCVKSGMNDIH